MLTGPPGRGDVTTGPGTGPGGRARMLRGGDRAGRATGTGRRPGNGPGDGPKGGKGCFRAGPTGPEGRGGPPGGGEGGLIPVVTIAQSCEILSATKFWLTNFLFSL